MFLNFRGRYVNGIYTGHYLYTGGSHTLYMEMWKITPIVYNEDPPGDTVLPPSKDSEVSAHLSFWGCT